MTNPIIIFGSSQSLGRTRKAIDQIVGQKEIPLVDLNTLKISPYDYEHKNQNDDYLPLMEKVIEHELIVLVTPVYWYTMSAQMKIFVDRLTDLLEIRKDLGRKLKGKKIFIVSTFQGGTPKGLEETFKGICDYMGMVYQGFSLIYSGENNQELLKNNQCEIEKARKILFGNN